MSEGEKLSTIEVLGLLLSRVRRIENDAAAVAAVLDKIIARESERASRIGEPPPINPEPF